MGTIAAMQMLDLPAGQSELIETFVELTKSERNPLKVAALRAQMQFTLTKVHCSRLWQLSVLVPGGAIIN